MEWLACGPDRSPIENKWYILKNNCIYVRAKVNKGIKISMGSTWEAIDLNDREDLGNSMPEKIKAFFNTKDENNVLIMYYDQIF